MAELSKAADAQSGPKFLHIVVKLADIESVYFSTSTGRELSAGQGSARPKSALTAALAAGPKKSVDVGNSRYEYASALVKHWHVARHIAMVQRCIVAWHWQIVQQWLMDVAVGMFARRTGDAGAP